MATRSSLRFLSFNMHGYNQSKNYLSHLCHNFDILFLQEHWLLPSKLSLLTTRAPNCCVWILRSRIICESGHTEG